MLKQSLTIKKEDARYFVHSIIHSYSQVFFSTHKPFAILLMIVTFYDIYAGLAGLLAVVTTSVAAFILNLHKPGTWARDLLQFWLAPAADHFPGGTVHFLYLCIAAGGHRKIQTPLPEHPFYPGTLDIYHRNAKLRRTGDQRARYLYTQRIVPGRRRPPGCSPRIL